MSVSEQRRHATEALAVGGGLIGAGAAANYGIDRLMERKGVKTPARSLLSRKPRLRPAHGPYMAGRVGTASLRTVGIPLAAYGAFNVLSPADKVARVRLKDDIVRPALDSATGRQQARKAKAQLSQNRASRKTAQSTNVGKADLTSAETEELAGRKSKGSKLALVGGTLGLAALGARTPELARLAAKTSRTKNLRGLKALAAKEPSATKASNALGIAAIGAGSIGSFNYAAQQKLERKQVQKSIPSEGVIRGLGKVRVLSQHSKDSFMVLDSRDTRRLVNRNRLTFTGGKKKAASKVKPASNKQMSLGFEKSDDRFLRNHSDRISPQAESGYRYLREGRNRSLKDMAKDPLHSVSHGKKAARWNKKMTKIRSKGFERASMDEYGSGREVTKALIPMGGIRLPRMRKPALRRSYISRSSSGRQFSVRGTTR